MNNINLLKKHALAYLQRYDSSKKNLERILKNKVLRMKNINKNEKDDLFNTIQTLISNLELSHIVNDENFAKLKIEQLLNKGKSELFIRNILFQKGIDKNIINKLLADFQSDNPNYIVESARKFALKKRLGKFGSTNNKKKDLEKMARAGFGYYVALKVLGYE